MFLSCVSLLMSNLWHPCTSCLEMLPSLETLAAVPLTFSVWSILLHIACSIYVYGKITPSRVMLPMQLVLWTNPEPKGQLQENLSFSIAFCWELQENHTNDLKTLWDDLLTTFVPRFWPQTNNDDWEQEKSKPSPFNLTLKLDLGRWICMVCITLSFAKMPTKYVPVTLCSPQLESFPKASPLH